MSIKNFLKQDSYWMVNKHIARKVGVEAAMLLSDLIDKQTYLETREELIEKEGEMWFFSTASAIEEATTLSPRSQRTSIDKLREAGFIRCKVFGVPPMRFFQICEAEILAYFELREIAKSNLRNRKIENAETQNQICDNAKSNLRNVETDFAKTQNTINNTCINNTSSNTGGYAHTREIKTEQPNTPPPVAPVPPPNLRDKMMQIYNYQYSQFESDHQLKYLRCEPMSFLEWKGLVDLVDKEYPEAWEYARFLTPPEYEQLKKDPNIRFTPDTFEIVLTEICSRIDPAINLHKRIKMYMTSPMTLKKLKRETNGTSKQLSTNRASDESANKLIQRLKDKYGPNFNISGATTGVA